MVRYPAISPTGVRRRIAWLLLGTLAAGAALTARLFYLQVVRHGHFTRLALEQRLRPLPLDAQRGTILDRSGNKLAISVSADAVYAVPSEVGDPAGTARKLASVLGMDAGEIEQRLRMRQATVWIARNLGPEQAQAIRTLRLPGIGLVERPQRVYPNGTLAAQVLGITGIDNQGLEGLEFYYDAHLRGVQGRVEAERDAAGREIPGGVSRYVPAEDGHTLVLTIDQVIQYRAERELERAVKETQSDFGLFVAVDPSTGEILAMAQYPGFDPNHYSDYPPEVRRNRAVTDQLEPGSTFKVVTGSAALEAGVVRPDDRFFDPGFVLIGGGKVSCWLPGGHGSQSFVEAVENSCNPVFAIIGAQRLGPALFYKFARAFGFGEPLGIDFPGEAAGSLPVPGSIAHGEILRWANIGFGQGVSVTPLQLVMAAATIANGGVLMKPHLVREIRTADGQVLERTSPMALRRVLSPATAQEFARMMRSVVVNGSGTRAEIPGYRVAGKTGTAQIPRPTGGYGDDTMASFLGFAPVDAPRIVGVVMLYRLKVQPRWGGLWAAPTFKAIMEDALGYLRVPRREEKPKQPSKDANGVQMVLVPNVLYLTAEEAAQKLGAAGLKTGIEGTGRLVVDQIPRGGAEVDPGTRVLLVLDQHVHPVERSEVEVPPVLGKSVRDVAAILAEYGLILHVDGSGFATFQSPSPGTRVPVGSPVEVRFEPPGSGKEASP
ncbi:penicillin-binding transpeptidase domain-containing protein [Carboxydochorda subterranea]|uniref:Penicillin-binding transpeptidase domain-containing protein n=1 Tax=Carboxydichorda subterranea TaxID=3109565 RepID=A0ABZ1C184_9FIRM|nr:penicillin-binding transpeptidase domain-containing protein [Limnochorda sp. L945t]WRP18620.1 penicillin-binding transpeptidase domain-containing protein [Limnochorda sp. L945t]